MSFEFPEDSRKEVTFLPFAKFQSGQSSEVSSLNVASVLCYYPIPSLVWASPVAQPVKNPPAMRETWVRSLGWEDRSPGEAKGYPLQYSGLENSMDCIVRGVTKSWT